MDAALELFAETGYHSSSISKIALRAGISKGLMYNYFSSKQELLIAIFDKGMHALFNLFDPDKDGILTSDEFDFFVDRVFETLKENTAYWKLYFNVIMQPGIYELIGKRFEKLLRDSLQLLYNYYEEQGVEDPMSEAMLFGAVMDGISMNYLLNPGMLPLEDIKRKIIQKFGHKSGKRNNEQ